MLRTTMPGSKFASCPIAMDTALIILVGAIVLTAIAPAAQGQAFADLKTALVDYSKADFDARKACAELDKFKSKDIAQISATSVPADAAAPAFCRVAGVLSPEIAFEVSLPAKWN